MEFTSFSKKERQILDEARRRAAEGTKQRQQAFDRATTRAPSPPGAAIATPPRTAPQPTQTEATATVAEERPDTSIAPRRRFSKAMEPEVLFNIETTIKLPDRGPYETKATMNQKQKIWDLGLRDHKLIDTLGKNQASAVIQQLMAALAEEGRKIAEREQQEAEIQRQIKARDDRAKALLWFAIITFLLILAIARCASR